ncbi:alpha/beta hydrolase [Paramicrobacterium fandaimingii]|uniref:alpha/beta hydrolase n=1 Tax=Paramicrobacterium fandaimingii TaxID=2708079 RepID=UPI001C3FDE09|nr:alpha/beta hydrolase [Microbacterium fandaimingii]
MNINDVDPRLREATRKSTTLNLENRLIRSLGGAASKLIPGKRVDGVERRLVREADVHLRAYIPSAPAGGALLWMHGGGLLLGSAAYDDEYCSQIARETDAVVVSVDYRLAQRHPFPAALDDCAAAFAWLRANASDLGVDLARVVVGGQSAGSGLAACLVQRLYDEGVQLAGQWLFCPMLDDRTAADRSRDDEHYFIWNNRANLVGWRSYLGDRVGARDLPDYAAASRRSDLTGLPPTWLYVSSIELFHDEVIDYARRLDAAGVDVTVDVVPGAPHGFDSWMSENPVAQELHVRAREWLDPRLSAR